MTKRWMLVAAVAGSACLGGFAIAGNRVSYPVTITKVAARGAMGTARNSSDSNQRIGCGFTFNATTPSYIQCWARDSFGNEVSCVAMNPSAQLQSAVASITPSSFIGFEWSFPGPEGWTGTCETLFVGNSSDYEIPR